MLESSGLPLVVLLLGYGEVIAMKFFDYLIQAQEMPEYDTIACCSLCGRAFCSADLVGGLCPDCQEDDS